MENQTFTLDGFDEDKAIEMYVKKFKPAHDVRDDSEHYSSFYLADENPRPEQAFACLLVKGSPSGYPGSYEAVLFCRDKDTGIRVYEISHSICLDRWDAEKQFKGIRIALYTISSHAYVMGRT